MTDKKRTPTKGANKKLQHYYNTIERGGSSGTSKGIDKKKKQSQ